MWFEAYIPCHVVKIRIHYLTDDGTEEENEAEPVVDTGEEKKDDDVPSTSGKY